MGEKEDLEKSVDFVNDQERDYAQNALNEFNKYYSTKQKVTLFYFIVLQG